MSSMQLRADTYMASTLRGGGGGVKGGGENEMLPDVGGGGSECSACPIFIFFIKENWTCAMNRHHAESNISKMFKCFKRFQKLHTEGLFRKEFSLVFKTDKQNQPLQVFYKKGVLKNFAKFTGKQALGLKLYKKRDSNTCVFLWTLQNF